MKKYLFGKITIYLSLLTLFNTALFAAGGGSGTKRIAGMVTYLNGLPPEATKFIYLTVFTIISFIVLAVIVALLVASNKLAVERISKEEKAQGYQPPKSFFKRYGLFCFRVVMALDLILMGYALYMVLKSQTLKPRSKPQSAALRVLEGMPVKLGAITMSLDGYGIVRPLQEISLSSEIKGRIVTKKAALKSGVIVKKGELLCEIDVSDYQEILAQLEAEITRLDEDVAMKKQTMTDLENEVVQLEKIYEIEKKNYERYMKLYKRNVSSKTDAETAQKSMLAQMKALINLRASISKAKIEIRSLNALKKKALSTVRKAKLDIERSKIYSPFAGRLLDVYVDNGEYVNVGTKLFDIADDSKLEIPVSLNAVDVARTLGLSASEIKIYENWMAMPDLPPVKIVWTEDKTVCAWEGKVVRIEGFNSTDGTVTMVVSPTKSLLEKDVPAVPLVAGMYCQVTFAGSKVKNSMVVPWSAIQSNSTIYLVDKNNIGHEVKTSIISSNNDSVIISEGLQNMKGYKIVTQRLPNNVVNGSEVKVVAPIKNPIKFVENNIAKLQEEEQRKKQETVQKGNKFQKEKKVKASPTKVQDKDAQSAIGKLPKAMREKLVINDAC